ncbi:MAG: hypothetical protein ABJ084_05185 [Halioglobus sp.]
MKKSAKIICLTFMSTLLLGCAQGRVDVLDKDGNVIGACTADFNFHWYGAQDSVDYILYLCAKENIDKGYRISDESILAKDYTIPEPPNGEKWTQQSAKDQFSKKLISEKKYGYILAAIEFRYWQKLDKAEEQLSHSEITQAEYKHLVREAKAEFDGTEEK